MKTKIKDVTGKDFNKALELYAETCHKDKFYCRLFKTDDCYSDIKKYFYNDVWSTIQYGTALGAYAGKQLIGVLLGFNIQNWNNAHPEEFKHIFNFDNEQTAYWYEAIDAYFKDTNRCVMYTYLVCVDVQFQHKGVATSLIRSMVTKYGKEFVLISDVSNPIAMPMWYKNGFKEVHLKVDKEDVLLLVYEGK